MKILCFFYVCMNRLIGLLIQFNLIGNNVIFRNGLIGIRRLIHLK